MFKSRYILPLLLSLGVSSSLFAQKPVAVKKIVFKGSAPTKFNGQYVYLFSNQPESIRDSSKIVNGAFLFSRPFTEARDYNFYSGYEKKATGDYSVLTIPVDKPSEISIQANIEKFELSEVKGSTQFFIFNAFVKKTNPVYEKLINDLSSKYGRDYLFSSKRDTTTEKFKNMISEYKAGHAVYKSLLNEMLYKTINQHPSSFASVLLLQAYSEGLNVTQLEELYHKLSPAITKNFFGANIQQQINGQKKSNIGNLIEDFTLNDPKDQPFRFSSLKGKYVLLDFWGSWCGPCHTAFKNLRLLHAKYQAKGFEILGIATEQDKNAWLKDLEKEKLPWLQVIDIEGEKNISLGAFAVNKYPTTVLVDPNGKIIGRDLNIIEIEKILDKL